jgi:hypothetical protein
VAKNGGAKWTGWMQSPSARRQNPLTAGDSALVAGTGSPARISSSSNRNSGMMAHENRGVAIILGRFVSLASRSRRSGTTEPPAVHHQRRGRRWPVQSITLA